MGCILEQRSSGFSNRHPISLACELMYRLFVLPFLLWSNPLLYKLCHYDGLDRAKVLYRLMVLDTARLEERVALLKSMKQVSRPILV